MEISGSAEELIRRLQAALGLEAVVTGASVAERAVSYWNSEPTRARAILLPRSTEDVSAALRLCYQYGQPVVIQGGLTGCVEGAVAGPDDVVISLEKMNAVEDIDEVGATCTVQGGAILQSVQEIVAEKGLQFPLDLGARGSCTIGGNIATNAGGINVIRYGMMRSLVLGLEAVLADGTVLTSMNTMLKNNAGYDLKQLFIGTEGTLGVVTRVVVRLFPKSGSTNAALVAMERFSDVTDLLQVLQRDLAGTLSAYEVMWGEYFRAVTEPGWHRAPMARNYPFYVVLQAEGAEVEADAERFERVLGVALKEERIVDAVIPKSESERRELWGIREDFEAILNPKPVYLYDVSLPIRDMEAYVREVRQGVVEAWPDGRCYVLGHIGDGNLHFFIAPMVAGELHAEADARVYGPLARYGGSVSAEHGIGTEKKAWLGHSRSPDEIVLMHQLKRTLDPTGILNPGIVLADDLRDDSFGD